MLPTLNEDHRGHQPLAAFGRVKLFWAVLLTLWITVPYHVLQRIDLFPVHVMRPSSIDRAIPMAQSMVWPYLSMFLLLPLAPWAISKPCEIRRFVVDFFLLGLVSSLVFLFWPTSVERPALAELHDPLYALLLRIDEPGNACPSMHAAMSVYSALWCLRLLRGRPSAIFSSAGIVVWTFAILYATIATRQHVLVDLLAGSALAGLVFFRTGPPRS